MLKENERKERNTYETNKFKGKNKWIENKRTDY
jgi:hypothetical protein